MAGAVASAAAASAAAAFGAHAAVAAPAALAAGAFLLLTMPKPMPKLVPKPMPKLVPKPMAKLVANKITRTQTASTTGCWSSCEFNMLFFSENRGENDMGPEGK
jgi:hypothetical protein